MKLITKEKRNGIRLSKVYFQITANKYKNDGTQYTNLKKKTRS